MQDPRPPAGELATGPALVASLQAKRQAHVPGVNAKQGERLK